MLKRFAQPQPLPIPPSAPAGRPASPPEAAASKPEREPPVAETSPDTGPGPAEAGNKLIVGPNIKLKGSEITDCDILLVEGRVEASMHSRDMRIAEGGIFVGVAEIDMAEVRGAFEGELVARKRLVIRASGRVSGKIRYGALTVEEGGTLTGDVGSLGAPARTASDSGKTHGTEPLPEARTEPLRPAAAVGRGALPQR